VQKVNKYCLTSIIKNKIVNFSWPRAIFDAKYMNEWTANYCIVYCNIEVNHEWRCFALRRQLLYHSLTHYLFEWHCCGWIISECSQETRCWFDLTLRSLTPLAAALGNNQRMVGAHLFISWWCCEEMPLSFSALVEWNDKKSLSAWNRVALIKVRCVCSSLLGCGRPTKTDSETTHTNDLLPSRPADRCAHSQ